MLTDTGRDFDCAVLGPVELAPIHVGFSLLLITPVYGEDSCEGAVNSLADFMKAVMQIVPELIDPPCE